MELIDIIPEFNLYEEYWKIYTKSEKIPPQFISAEAKVGKSIIERERRSIWRGRSNSCDRLRRL